MTSPQALAFLSKYQAKAPSAQSPQDGCGTSFQDELQQRLRGYRILNVDAAAKASTTKTKIVAAVPMGCDSSAVASLRLASLHRHNFPLDWVQSSPASLGAVMRHVIENNSSSDLAKGIVSWEESSDEGEESAHEDSCPLFEDYRKAYTQRQLHNPDGLSTNTPQYVSHQPGTLFYSRVPNDGAAATSDNSLVLDSHFGAIGKVSEVKALWQRWWRVPALLRRMAQKANGEPEPLNVLLLCVGRVSGDVSGLVAIVDGTPLCHLAVSRMSQSGSVEHSHEWSILQSSVEAAAVIGDAATAGRPQGSKKPLGIHVALVNVFNEGHLKSSSTPGCPFRICVAPNHVNELNPYPVPHPCLSSVCGPPLGQEPLG